MDSIPANKTNLGKIIKWSSSRFNELKKEDIIDDILDKINAGRNLTFHYATGAFSEKSHLGEWSYDLIIKDGTFFLIENSKNKQIKVKLIIKPSKNKKGSDWKKAWNDYADYIEKQKAKRLEIEKPIVVDGHYQTYNGKKIWKEKFRRKKPRKLPKQSNLGKFLR